MKNWLLGRWAQLGAWYKDAEFITWSRLATFGNNPLVKLTILTPLVAQVLIHKDTITFLARYDFTKVEWLYASLMFFFVAQLIYTFRCHRDIKDYPSEIKFVQAMEAAIPDEDLNREYFDVYKKYFKKYGGNIDQDKYDLAQARHYAARKELKISRLSNDIFPSGQFDEIATARNIDDVRKSIDTMIIGIRHGRQFEVIDWNLMTSFSNSSLSEMYQTKKFEGDSYRSSNETIELLKMIGEARLEFSSSHWRAKAINRRYIKLNTSNFLARSFAAIFYGLGSIYFIWTSVFNVCRVLNTYGWVV